MNDKLAFQTYGDITSPALFSKDIVRNKWHLAKETVRALKYPVDSFETLWQLLTENPITELSSMIKLVQFAAVLLLHTADSERVFSQQNKIIT